MCKQVNRDTPLTLADERIARAIRENNARLVIIDPVQAFLGTDVDMNRANEVRPIFRSLGAVSYTHLTFLMGFLYTIFFLFSFIGLIHSVQLTHVVADCTGSRRLFLFKKPSLTCSVAPPFQNANISLVCILVFLPMLENSRTPCLFVHFTKGRVSIFDVQKTII